MNWIDTKYLNMKIRTQKFVDEFLNGEQGVSAFIATILLLVIVVALCAIFWTNIKQWFDTTWEQIIAPNLKEFDNAKPGQGQ